MPLYRAPGGGGGGDGLNEATVLELIDDKIAASGSGVQDSGWRDISALWAAAGWAYYGYGPQHRIRIRRVGFQVTLAGTAFGNIPDSPGYAEIDLPEGFRPTTNSLLLSWSYQYDVNTKLLWFVTATKLRVSGYDGADVTGECSWTTDDPWPSALPGSALNME